MTNFNIGRWLLVALAIVGLTLVTPIVSAHGDETTAADAPKANGTVAEWPTWMEGHMIDHLSPGAVEWTESHMGVTVDGIAQDVAHGDNGDGMYGQRRGC
ncbi:hypothetical protein [Halosimplex halophilum]|uniref:hypothetical protein n=1 Tax=Halosimplex halophilum TaxID=2559572 RepID=UPI00107F5A71|nr:hypothetical protein [Halosimplex halophilum]